jgi:hypothetical protein
VYSLRKIMKAEHLEQILVHFIGRPVTPEMVDRITAEIQEALNLPTVVTFNAACQSGELFFTSKGKAAFVPYTGDNWIDWDLARGAFAKAAGVKDPDEVETVGLDVQEWIGAVPYTWGLAGSAGAHFRTYQFPDVPASAVAFCRSRLRRDRDVVGRIPNVEIKEWVSFGCPMEPKKKL